MLVLFCTEMNIFLSAIYKEIKDSCLSDLFVAVDMIVATLVERTLRENIR